MRMDHHGGLPHASGIGLKPQHYGTMLTRHAPLTPSWVEVHPQNYFGDGGPPHRWLSAIRERYPISFHSVGLSLGSVDGLSEYDLDRIAKLCQRYQPAVISDHLSFSGNAHDRFADLLPVPYTKASLMHFTRQIERVQDRLKRPMLVENPSRYLAYRGDEMEEVEFIERLLHRTGCRLLLDINNVEVSAVNLGFSPENYIDSIRLEWVGEIHLAGHATEHHECGPLLIDDHGSPVSGSCWTLYERFIARAGPKPTLIEWDNDVPEFETLMAEAEKADRIMETCHAFA